MGGWNRKTLEEALSDKYVVDTTTGCWNWTACKGRTGYGKMGHYVNGRNKFYSAHRASFLVHKGPIPAGTYVLHTCDNRGCVNPDHLYLGDQHDNMADVMRRGRHRSRKITHCPKGHPYEGDNLRLAKGGRHRVCKACMRDACSKSRAERRHLKIKIHLLAETPKGVMCNRRNDKATTRLAEVTCKQCLKDFHSVDPRRTHKKPEAA